MYVKFGVKQRQVATKVNGEVLNQVEGLCGYSGILELNRSHITIVWIDV